MAERLEYPASCPYCDAAIDLFIDPSIENQEYVEDCPVCCQPWLVRVGLEDGVIVDVQLRRENE